MENIKLSRKRSVSSRESSFGQNSIEVKRLNKKYKKDTEKKIQELQKEAEMKLQEAERKWETERVQEL